MRQHLIFLIFLVENKKTGKPIDTGKYLEYIKAAEGNQSTPNLNRMAAAETATDKHGGSTGQLGRQRDN